MVTIASPLISVDEVALSAERTKRIASARRTEKVVAEVLKELRITRHLTVQKVATDVGVRLKLVTQAETGDPSAVALAVLFTLLSYYKVSVSDFFKEVSARQTLREFTKDPKTKPSVPYVV